MADTMWPDFPPALMGRFSPATQAMTPQSAATHIEAALRALASGLQAAPMRAYMLKQFAFLGIRATPRREALRDLPKLSGSRA